MKGKDLKKIRKWYHDHGMEFKAEDWGQRADTGESTSQQRALGERYSDPTGDRRRVRGWGNLPGDVDSFETGRRGALWYQRSLAERERLERLEEFFDPYLVRLPKRQEDLIRDVVGNRRTFEEIAAQHGSSRQAAYQAFKRAVFALVREVERHGESFRSVYETYLSSR